MNLTAYLFIVKNPPNSIQIINQNIFTYSDKKANKDISKINNRKKKIKNMLHVYRPFYQNK